MKRNKSKSPSADISDDSMSMADKKLRSSIHLKQEALNEKEQLLTIVDQHLNAFIEKLLVDDGLDEDSILSRTRGVSQRADENDPLPVKEFKLRDSLLTELLQFSHFRTLQNIFIAIMAIFSLNTLIQDILDGRSLKDTLSLPLIFWAFGKFQDVIAIWFLMMGTTLLFVYPTFMYYIESRDKNKRTQYETPWILLYVCYQVAFLIYPVYLLLHAELPPASSIIILTEQSRLLMKTHAFIWENRVRKEQPECPKFGHFLYFLFAPTLVYRDEYPIGRPTRWGYVASNLGQVLACTFFTYLVLVHYCLPVFGTWRRPSMSKFTITVFRSALPGGLILLIGFFAILHSWLNAFAEMMRFGDRLFYRDWWNVTSFRRWYRTWNTVVHDWLYAYVYRELLLALGDKYRSFCMAVVFILSAVFHEYVISLSLGFFFPALFVFFSGAGFALMFANGRSRFWAVFMWGSLFLGMGALLCLYSMEWYARRNCPSSFPKNSLLDFMVPRSITCRLI